MNLSNLSLEMPPREWDTVLHNLVIGGLIGITFCLFFVRLNHLVEYAFWGLLFVWILGQWKNGSLKWINTPLDFPILFYVLWSLICVPVAVDPAYSFDEWKKIVAQILLFYFVVQTVKTLKQIHSIFLAGAIGLVALSAVESFYFFAQGKSIWHMSYRAGDLTGSSQWFSVYLVMGLPMLWFSLKMSKDVSTWFKITWVLGLGVSLLGLFLAHTRGAWVAIVIQVFILVLLRIQRNWWVAFGGAGLLVCIFLIALSLPSVYQSLSSISPFTNTGTMQVRFNTWALALQDIVENPLTGIGLGKHSFSRLHPGLEDSFHANLHNTFLARVVQVGIPGFLFFVWIFVKVLSRAAFLSRCFSKEFAGTLALATSLIVTGLVIRNLFDDMFNGTVSYLFWLLVGLFVSTENTISSQKKNCLA